MSYARTKTADGLPVYHPDFPGSLPAKYEDMWHRIWRAGAGIYTESDYDIVLRYVQMTIEYDKALAIVVQFGHSELGSQGQQVEAVELKALGKFESILSSIEDRLGLNPRAAGVVGLGKVKAGDAAPDSMLGEFLASSF